MEEFNYECKINNSELPKDDPVRRKPDISLAKRLLNWSPQIKMEDGIKRTINWFKENSNV